MLKTVLLGIALAAAGVVSAADDIDYAMYWQISASDYDGVSLLDTSKLATAKLCAELSGGNEVVFAEIRLPSGTTYTGNIYGDAGLHVVGKTAGALGVADTVAKYEISWSDIQTASFYVELWSESGLLAMSEMSTFAAVREAFAVNDPRYPSFASRNYVAQNYVVPEPTSGLLLIFGLAGLALRRKRT